MEAADERHLRENLALFVARGSETILRRQAPPRFVLSVFRINLRLASREERKVIARTLLYLMNHAAMDIDEITPKNTVLQALMIVSTFNLLCAAIEVFGDLPLYYESRRRRLSVIGQVTENLGPAGQILARALQKPLEIR